MLYLQPLDLGISWYVKEYILVLFKLILVLCFNFFRTNMKKQDLKQSIMSDDVTTYLKRKGKKWISQLLEKIRP